MKVSLQVMLYALLISSAGLSSCGPTEQEIKQAQEQEEREGKQEAIRKFAGEYRAPLFSDIVKHSKYTYQVQDSLTKGFVCCTGRVYDIYQKDTVYILRMYQKKNVILMYTTKDDFHAIKRDNLNPSNMYGSFIVNFISVTPLNSDQYYDKSIVARGSIVGHKFY